MNKIRILIADDHNLFRGGLKMLLSRVTDFEIVGEVTDGVALVDFFKNELPDVALVDISMPKMLGIDAIAEIKKTNSHTKFILLTMHQEGEYVLKGLKNGASAYLFKDVEPSELEKAIRVVAKGDKYYNQTVSNILIENMSAPKEEETVLTQREKEILELVAAGLSTKIIADKLNISHRTVDTHRVNMMKKMEVSNTAELVKKAIEKKII
jgi:DNA-binding NarL/FixJ family response regulator